MAPVHCDEGIANRIGPEPCVVGREAGGEASAGVRIGQPLSRERINWDADAVVMSGRQNGGARQRERVFRSCVVEDPHMGVFGSSGQVHRHIKKLRLLFRYPRSEPYFMTWLVPHQIKLTSGRHSKQLYQYPAFGGWGSGGRDHSFTRLFKPVHCSVPIAWIRQDRLGPEDWKDCVGAS